MFKMKYFPQAAYLSIKGKFDERQNQLFPRKGAISGLKWISY